MRADHCLSSGNEQIRGLMACETFRKGLHSADMFRLLRKLVFVLILAAIVAAGLLVFMSQDPMYATQELLSFGRHAQQDALIKEMAAKHNVDPALVKAIVWRESGFRLNSQWECDLLSSP